jgi:hypothetical protein
MPRRKSAAGDFWVIVGLMLMLGLPAWLTRGPSSPRLLVPADARPTPCGYTWSHRLLFIIPVLAIGWKVLSLRERGREKRSG